MKSKNPKNFVLYYGITLVQKSSSDSLLPLPSPHSPCPSPSLSNTSSSSLHRSVLTPPRSSGAHYTSPRLHSPSALLAQCPFCPHRDLPREASSLGCGGGM